MAAKKSAKKYGPKASKKVARAMKKRKAGTLRSGGSGRKVKSRKQAIAIGLSEARAAGGKVPSKKGSKKGAKKSAKKGSKKGAKKTTRKAAKKGSRRSSKKS